MLCGERFILNSLLPQVTVKSRILLSSFVERKVCYVLTALQARSLFICCEATFSLDCKHIFCWRWTGRGIVNGRTRHTGCPFTTLYRQWTSRQHSFTYITFKNIID